jgi:hypothetical protein
MDPATTYSASTSTATPLLAKPPGARSLPKSFNGFLRKPAHNPLVPIHGRNYDAKKAAFNTANSPLDRRLKGRHLQMIAIGGSIGWWHSNILNFHSLSINISKVPVFLSAQGKRCRPEVQHHYYLHSFSLDLFCIAQYRPSERWP